MNPKETPTTSQPEEYEVIKEYDPTAEATKAATALKQTVEQSVEKVPLGTEVTLEPGQSLTSLFAKYDYSSVPDNTGIASKLANVVDGKLQEKGRSASTLPVGSKLTVSQDPKNNDALIIDFSGSGEHPTNTSVSGDFALKLSFQQYGSGIAATIDLNEEIKIEDYVETLFRGESKFNDDYTNFIPDELFKHIQRSQPSITKETIGNTIANTLIENTTLIVDETYEISYDTESKMIIITGLMNESTEDAGLNGDIDRSNITTTTNQVKKSFVITL